MLTLTHPSTLHIPKSSPNLHFPVTSFQIQRISPSSSSSSRLTITSAYKITVLFPNGSSRQFEAPDDAYILDSADSAGIDLPCSCRAGACGSCAGKIVSGSVNQLDAAFLDDTQLESGYVLLCAAYPNSDCVIHTHKDSELY